MNAGPIIHPPLMVMNAAPLQHFERWDIHAEGTQPAVRAVTDRLDLERIAVREALGYGAPHYPLADHYANDRWMYGDAHKKLVDSGDWREHIDLHTHRYVTEDTELGLAFLASVARWCGVDAPVAHGLLAVTGAFLGRDLRYGPRTLEALGLDSLDRDALQRLLHTASSERWPATSPRGRPHGPRHRHRLRLRRPRDRPGRSRAGARRRRANGCATRRSPRSARAWRSSPASARWQRARSRRSPRACAGSTAADAPAALADAEMVFEGVPETLEAKRDALAEIGRRCRADAVVTSTTSSILVTQLAPLIAQPERFLNLHWLNPAYLIPVVELSVHPGTERRCRRAHAGDDGRRSASCRWCAASRPATSCRACRRW